MALPNIFLNKADKLMDTFFDPENNDKITLQDNFNKTYEFEQVALIPLQKQKKELFAILKPVTKIEGVGEDEGLVFHFKKEFFSYKLVIVQDQALIDEVFTMYDKLAQEQA